MITTESHTWGGKEVPRTSQISQDIWTTSPFELQLDDANGIFDMQNDDIFAGMGAIGYPPVAGSPAVDTFVPHPPAVFSCKGGNNTERHPETELGSSLTLSHLGNDSRPCLSVLHLGPHTRRTDSILVDSLRRTHAGLMMASTPQADAAVLGEGTCTSNRLSCKIDRCMGRIDLIGNMKGDVDIQDAVDLEGLSRMASEALGHDQATVPSEDIEEREEEEVPLRRKRSVHRRARTEFYTRL
ncbi:hypothetical protein Tco_1102509 [Tanacetum coccineum]